jgi:hypothetical protein
VIVGTLHLIVVTRWWYNRSPELYLLGYKYSTLVGGLTAALSYSANHTHGQ